MKDDMFNRIVKVVGSEEKAKEVFKALLNPTPEVHIAGDLYSQMFSSCAAKVWDSMINFIIIDRFVSQNDTAAILAGDPELMKKFQETMKGFRDTNSSEGAQEIPITAI